MLSFAPNCAPGHPPSHQQCTGVQSFICGSTKLRKELQLKEHCDLVRAVPDTGQILTAREKNGGLPFVLPHIAKAPSSQSPLMVKSVVDCNDSSTT